jgi:hypothetical protein
MLVSVLSSLTYSATNSTSDYCQNEYPGEAGWLLTIMGGMVVFAFGGFVLYKIGLWICCKSNQKPAIANHNPVPTRKPPQGDSSQNLSSVLTLNSSNCHKYAVGSTVSLRSPHFE